MMITFCLFPRWSQTQLEKIIEMYEKIREQNAQIADQQTSMQSSLPTSTPPMQTDSLKKRRVHSSTNADELIAPRPLHSPALSESEEIRAGEKGNSDLVSSLLHPRPRSKAVVKEILCLWKSQFSHISDSSMLGPLTFFGFSPTTPYLGDSDGKARLRLTQQGWFVRRCILHSLLLGCTLAHVNLLLVVLLRVNDF